MKCLFGFTVLTVCFALLSSANAQVIDLQPGDVITDGTAIANGTIVNVNGGVIETNVDLSDGELNINSGSVALGALGISGAGSGFTNNGNLVNLNGGDVGGFFQLTDTVLNIFGGSIESFGLFDATTEVNISGGQVTRFPDIFDGTVNISGGDVFAVRLFDEGTLNLIGDNFQLDGTPISLNPGESLEITQREQLLSGTLADGTNFSYQLSSGPADFFSASPSQFTAGSTLNIVSGTAAVPEPSGVLILGCFSVVAGLGRRRR